MKFNKEYDATQEAFSRRRSLPSSTLLLAAANQRRRAKAPVVSGDRAFTLCLVLPPGDPISAPTPFEAPSDVPPAAPAGDALDPDVPAVDLLAPTASCGGTMKH